MLKKNLLVALLTVFSLLPIISSCEKTPLVGKWEPMKLVSDTNLKGENTISVPAEGGTIHVTCTNYDSFWFPEGAVIVDGQPFKDPNSKALGSVLSTPWLKAAVKKNVMTVVVEPNTISKVRTTRFEITAGDVRTRLRFEQEAKK